MTRTNPTDVLNVSFSEYVKNRKAVTEAHMEGGVPDYSYGPDYAIRQKIRAIPGAFAFFKALTSQVIPKIKQQTNLNSLKVGPSQFPDVYRHAADCAKTLGIGIPTVFIADDASINAYTYALDDDEPLIVIHSGLLERFTPGELRTVIGHECGHVHNNHGIYTLAVNVILNSLSVAIPGVNQILQLISTPLQLALMAWERAAEISCDRAGTICSDDDNDVLTSLAKFMYGGALNCGEVNIDAILKQYDSIRTTPVRLLEAVGADHPIPVRRIFAAKEFTKSEIYYSWRPEFKKPDMSLIGKQELDARCEKYVSVTKSDRRRGSR